MDQSAPLSDYAWPFRYPGEVEVPTAEETNEALQIARTVFTKILKHLPPEAHPRA